MKLLKTLVFLLSVLFFSYSEVYSTIFISQQDGYWADTSTWTQGAIPLSYDTVYINHFVQINTHLVIDAPGHVLINSPGKVCGRDLYLTVNCGGLFHNYGELYIDSMFVHGKAFNYGYIDIKAFANISGPCTSGTSFSTSGGGSVNIQDSITCDLTTTVHQSTVPLTWEISIYPNPARDYIMVSTTLDLQDARLSVYNILGKPVLELPGIFYQDLRLDLNGLSKGLYYLSIETSTGRITKRIVLL